MRPTPALFAALLLPFSAAAADYASCLLDKLPGTQNDVAAHAAHQLCVAKFPGGLQAVKQGSGRGFFGYDSGAECTFEKSADTPSRRAGMLIGAACKRLYDLDLEYDPSWRPPSR